MTWTTDELRNLSLPDVSGAHMDEVRTLGRVWADRLERNTRRSVYYSGEMILKSTGLSELQGTGAGFCLGWPTMAVRKAAVRSQFDGLALPGTSDPLDLGEILTRNRFGVELSQATHSAYQHGVSFVVVSAGGPGEPGAVIHAHSAEHAAAVWDGRRRRIHSALVIHEYDDDRPVDFTVLLADVTIRARKEHGVWSTQADAHRLGRAPVAAVTYDPQLGRPLGRSRITRPVMELSDMAARAYLRMEQNAEIYSSPIVVVEGIDDDGFDTNPGSALRFKLTRERALALTRDADGNAPTAKQLQQATMSPHSEMIRTLAMAFSGETGIPPSALGVIHDQPSSAEAIRAAEHDLLIDVTNQNRFVLAEAAEDVARLAWMTLNPGRDLPGDAWRLQAKFADPEFRSASMRADAALKMSAHPMLADSTVTLEELYDQDTIRRIEDDHRRAAGRSGVIELLKSKAGATGDDAGGVAGTVVGDADAAGSAAG